MLLLVLKCFWQQHSCYLTCILGTIKGKHVYPEILWSVGVFHVHTSVCGVDLSGLCRELLRRFFIFVLSNLSM